MYNAARQGDLSAVVAVLHESRADLAGRQEQVGDEHGTLEGRILGVRSKLVACLLVERPLPGKVGGEKDG